MAFLDISKEDLVEDENEIEEKKDAGIEDDKNSFDQLLKINEGMFPTDKK